MSKPGRNEPCPCGSGRKYKRCCLGREAEHDAFAAALESRVLPLLSQLATFAQTAAGAPLESIAASAFPFWRGPLDDARASRLIDYLIFDARPERIGRTAIDQFVLERGPLLDDSQRAMLGRWRDARRRLYRIDGWSAGFYRCTDLSIEEPTPIDVWPLGREAGAVADGSAAALRALPALEKHVCIGRPATFGARSAVDVQAAVRGRHLDYVRSQRIVSMDDFLRAAPTALDEEAASAPSSGIIMPGA